MIECMIKTIIDSGKSYGKKIGENGKTHVVHLTSVPPPIDAYFQAFRQLAT